MPKLTPKELEQLAWEYVCECEENTKQHPTASGKVVNIKDRHIPTIQYFLKIWIPKKGIQSISRTTYYNWLNSENEEVKLTLINIEGVFEALTTDIVANEGKGVFYAKNKLGWKEHPHTFIEQPLFVLESQN